MNKVTEVVPKERWYSATHAKCCQYQDCGTEFGYFSSRYNCHRCGIVICKKCVRNSNIPGHYDNEVPICPRCYDIVSKLKLLNQNTKREVKSEHRADDKNIQQKYLRTEPANRQNNEEEIVELQRIIKELEARIIEENETNKEILNNYKKTIQIIAQENEHMKSQLQEYQKPSLFEKNPLQESKQMEKGNRKERDMLEQRLNTVQAERDELKEQLTANANELQQRINTVQAERDE